MKIETKYSINDEVYFILGEVVPLEVDHVDIMARWKAKREVRDQVYEFCKMFE